MPPDFDLIIVGGGAVGVALAVALSEHSRLSVALVDSASLQPRRAPPSAAAEDSFDLRVNALNPSSIRFLQRLGAWEPIAAERAQPFTDMEVWDGAGSGRIRFAAAEVGLFELGSVVENRLMCAALLTRLNALKDRISCFENAGLERIEAGHSGWQLQLNGGRCLSSSLVVGADGGRSAVRSAVGFGWRQWDPGQQAIVATVRTTEPHRGTALQCFLPTGPLAFLPLSGPEQTLHSIVWSLDSSLAERMLALDKDDFCTQLGAAFEHRLGRVVGVGKRAAFPLHQGIARWFCRGRCALVGDAARVLHPLAGQGVNFGLRDAAVLAEELGKAEHLEPSAAFAAYARRRLVPSWRMLAAMTGFHRLFGDGLWAARLLRNRGLSWVDRQTALKKLLMREALGSQ